jgi:hypothetical protein
MSIEPLIIISSAKRISVRRTLEKLEKFTSVYCHESAASILDKQSRLSRPSDDIVDKVKTMINSITEEKEAYSVECSKYVSLQISNSKKSNKKEKRKSSSSSDQKKKPKKSKL